MDDPSESVSASLHQADEVQSSVVDIPLRKDDSWNPKQKQGKEPLLLMKNSISNDS